VFLVEVLVKVPFSITEAFDIKGVLKPMLAPRACKMCALMCVYADIPCECVMYLCNTEMNILMYRVAYMRDYVPTICFDTHVHT